MPFAPSPARKSRHGLTLRSPDGPWRPPGRCYGPRMDVDQAQAVTVPLTAAERHRVELAAAVAGKTTDAFVRDAVIAAAYDPLVDAIERAADTVAARRAADQIRHDFAR